MGKIKKNSGLLDDHEYCYQLDVRISFGQI